MLKPSFWKLAAILAVVALGVFALESQAPRVGNAPVVVELFTSQGCSSCPPADALLRRIANDPKLRGKVIPLAFHVDYWNSLGWRDPFSRPEWSARQRDYVEAMRLSTAYTPQIVVNGAREMVGSNNFAVFDAIEEESQRKTDSSSVTIARTANGADVKAQSPRTDVELIVVTFENGITTNVERGENEGKTLVNDAIVRSLVHAPRLVAHVDVDKRLGVAAFLQERGTRRILTAASSPP